MEMCFHRADWTAGLGRNLGQRSFREEAQRDGLAIRLVEPSDGAPDVGGSLRTEGQRRRIEAAVVVGVGCVGRVRPCHRSPPSRLTQGDANRDPAEPRAERAVAAVRRERAVRDHERFLGCVLGVAWVAEDAVAGAHAGCRHTVDEDAVRVTIAREDRVDGRAVDRPLGPRWRGVTDDDVDREIPPFGSGDPGWGRQDRAVARCKSP